MTPELLFFLFPGVYKAHFMGWSKEANDQWYRVSVKSQVSQRHIFITDCHRNRSCAYKLTRENKTQCFVIDGLFEARVNV